MKTALHPSISPCGRCSTFSAIALDDRRGEVLGFDDDLDERAELDVEPLKLAPDPGKPTERQIEEHLRSHLSFRSFCR